MAFAFDQDDYTSQAKAVVALFGRISDLHNIDAVVRALSKRAQDEVIARVGWLNLFNPLKPAFAYVVPLTFWDSRTLVATLLEMGKAEAEGQVKEDPRTDVPVADLHEKLATLVERTPEASRPDVVRFAYGEVGEVTNHVAWEVRVGMLSRCLVGTGVAAMATALPPGLTPPAPAGGLMSPTKVAAAAASSPAKGLTSPTAGAAAAAAGAHASPSPVNAATVAELARIAEQRTGRGLFDVVDWYRAIHAADAFTSGPIDQQYATFKKYPKPPPLSPPPRSYSAQARRQTGAPPEA